MSTPAIIVENLSKQYRLGLADTRHQTFREMLLGAVKAPFRRLRELGERGTEEDTFWALKDVSFEVQPGEVVGIIGRNGAGKSTLLKILSRITEPTSGRARLRGRVASLLEVGTGFHPELSGRENIYLNGAILGMKKVEIDRKFDEIVAFSEIEKFLDTPVKRYSSGMYVRLAFAVAAHLEPEILIVDEVLAVGDAEFQKKCLGKMREVSRGGGRTVLFVSHNMGAIRELCGTCCWVHGGRLRERGLPAEIVSAYLSSSDRSSKSGSFQTERDPRKAFQLVSGRFLGQPGTSAAIFNCDEPVVMEFECESAMPIPGLYGYLGVSRSDGTLVMVSDSFDVMPNQLDRLAAGRHRMRISIPQRTLGPGEYLVYLNFTSAQSSVGVNVDSPGTVLSFRLDDFNTRRGNRREGFLSTRVVWNVDKLEGHSIGASIEE